MFDRPQTRLRLCLLAGAAACAAAALVGELRFGSSLYFFTDVKGKPGHLQGALTAVSGFLLVAAAVLCAGVGQRLAKRHKPGGRAFTAFGALLVLLAFDEIVMLHEFVAEKLAAGGVPKPFGLDHDLYVFGVYGLVGAALLAGMLPFIRRARIARPALAAMLAFAAASQGLDFVPWSSLTSGQQAVLGPVEESLKLMATLAACLWARMLLLHREPGRRWPAPPALPHRPRRQQRPWYSRRPGATLAG